MGHKVTRTCALMAALIVLIAAPAAAQEGTPGGDAAPREVTIGETVVSWSGAWKLDDDATTDELATLTILDEASVDLKLATYGEMADESVEGPIDALDVFAEAFLSDPGVSNAVESGSGKLENGAVWMVYTYDLDGVAVATVFTVSEGDESTFIVSTLTAAVAGFPEAVAEAQEHILLDGEEVFLGGVDGEAIAPVPSATPDATLAD